LLIIMTIITIITVITLRAYGIKIGVLAAATRT
jgi:hypothetical protein